MSEADSIPTRADSPPSALATEPPVADSPPAREERATRSRRVSTIVEWIAVIGGALVVALVIKTFLFQAFYIPSSSMEPTLAVGDRVLVNKLSYRVHDVNRGDLIVFERPEGEAGDVRDLIKRVIALPGETVEGLDGQVLIDGQVLDEPYLPDGVITRRFDAVEVGAREAFMMGDNRSDSRDSRFFGPISEDSIVGRAFLRVWPIGNVGFL